jgi:hypothetical protein
VRPDRAILSESLPTKRNAAAPRVRGVITTLLLIGLAVLIVRDILARRWGSAAPTPPDVTQRSR